MDERYDAEALRLARQASAPGESVLWAGRPGRRRLPSWEMIHPAALLAAAVGTGLWKLWEDRGQLAERWWWFALMFLFVAAPLALAVWSVRRRDRAVYAVTDWRVLILGPDGTVWGAVGLERADAFRRQGHTVTLGGEDEALRLGKGDSDGGLGRFERLPRLERLADSEQVMATIRRAAARATA